jgi:hypothetical protein
MLAGLSPEGLSAPEGIVSRQPAAPFRDRLALARRMVARGTTSAPVHLADQLAAASTDARRWHDRLGVVLPAVDPARRWYHHTDGAPSDDTRAYLLAALLGCTTVCLHLRRGGPRPAVARLPLHRVDCERCSATLYRPPVGEDDRCDICTARGVTTFVPFAIRLGPALLAGDACPTCVGVLGIRTEVAS